MVRGKTAFVLAGAGKALPEKRLDNETLGRRLSMTADAIYHRTGIRERRVASEGESASALGAVAARQALERAGVHAEDIDLVVLSTYTPDHQLCPTSPALAHALGARRAGTFDVNAACSGGVTALLAASAMLPSFETVLVVTSDVSTFYVKSDDPKTAMVFGDGASALVLRHPEAAPAQPWQILAATMGADGSGADLFRVPDGGSARPPINGFAISPIRTIEMDGRAVFRFAVERGAQVISELCRQAGLTPYQVDFVIPHQANQRILAAMSERLEIPGERWVSNIERYGNTASSSIPIALTELFENRRIKPGQTVLLVAFGAGLTWSGVALRAGDVPPVA